MAKWFQLIVRAPIDRADEVAAWLLSAGALGLETLDADHLSPPPDLSAGSAELRASFESAGWQVEKLLADLTVQLEQLGLGAGASAPTWRWVDTQDWANNWKDHFSPVRIGRFGVHPGWEEPDPAARWSIQIDPGLAFGTGMHPTTRLCLAALDEQLGQRQDVSVLDVGCGSGILAIAAAMAGARPVVAVDNDPEACRVTAENAALNGQADRLRVLPGGGRAVEARFDLVLANILSGPLIAMRFDLAARLEPDGVLVLSGLLAEEAKAVVEAFGECDLRLIDQSDEEGWSALTLVPDAAREGRG